MKGLVDVHVNYFDGNGCWYVSCLASENEAGDDDPRDFDEMEEFRTKERAVRFARCTARYVVSSNQAKRAVLFVGNRDGLSKSISVYGQRC